MKIIIAQNNPGVQEDRSSTGTKPATLGIGLVISVTLFINQSDKVVVNMDTSEYVERVE